MTIKVKFPQKSNPLLIPAKNIQEGHAYVLYGGDHNMIFIGNSLRARNGEMIMGFSLNGKNIAWENDTEMYQEIDLVVEAKFKN